MRQLSDTCTVQLYCPIERATFHHSISLKCRSLYYTLYSAGAGIVYPKSGKGKHGWCAALHVSSGQEGVPCVRGTVCPHGGRRWEREVLRNHTDRLTGNMSEFKLNWSQRAPPKFM